MKQNGPEANKIELSTDLIYKRVSPFERIDQCLC